MQINDIQIDERRGCTSASNAQADALCSGRHLAQKGLPDQQSEDAAFGDVIHKALADSGDITKLNALTLEQREVFDQCREIEKKLIAQFLPEAGENNDPKNRIRIFREKRLWVMVDGKWEHSAKPDMVARCGPRGLVVEYKSLPGDVPDSPLNLQLRDQVVLASGTYLLNEIAVAIIQPLVTMTPQVTVYTADHIKQAESQMFERVRRSNDPKSLRVAGEVQCKFCKAKRQCPEYQTFAGGSVPAMLSILDVPIAQWTPEQRAVFCDRLSVAQKWLDDAKEFVKEGLSRDPNFCPGWALRPGNKRETIKDPQAVFDRFATIGGTVQQFMKTVTVRKEALREAVNALTGAKGKSLDAAITTLTDGLVDVKHNAPSLSKIE